MPTSWLARLITAGAALAQVCIVAAVVLSLFNRGLRQDVAERQQTISQALAVSQLNTRLVTALATVAARDNDEQLRTLLARNGVTISAAGPAAAPKAPGTR